MVVKVVNSYCSCKSKGEREWIENYVCSFGESSHPLTYSLDFIKKMRMIKTHHPQFNESFYVFVDT